MSALYRPGEVDASDPRTMGLPPAVAAALHDAREAARARKLRRIMCGCFTTAAFLLGLAAGLMWGAT